MSVTIEIKTGTRRLMEFLLAPLMPSARFGFSQNLAGSELRYLNAGITFMKFFNLDVATTLDTVTLDGDKYMRGLNVSLGVQYSF